MNDADAPEPGSEHLDKGKSRATEATERTPLLVSSSGSPYILSEEAGHPAESSQGLRRKLTTVFFTSLVVCIVSFTLFGLLAWSYVSKVSGLDPNDFIQQDLVFSGPDGIKVVNVSQAGIWLNIQGRIGVDAGKAIGVGNKAEDGVLDNLWKAVGGWGVRTLDRVTVNMTTIRITPDYNPTETLLNFDIPPIELPLTVNPPDDLTWLTPISSSVLMRPTSNRTVLLGFLKESWRRGRISVRAHVEQASIRGGALDELDWRRIFSKRLLDVRTIVNMKLPSIPGLPGSGRNTPFPSVSKLVTLTSFSITSESDTLSLRGTVTAINPVPYDLHLSTPSLPFDVSMLDPTYPASPAIHVASVSTLPFTLTHPNVSLSLQGSVPAISAAAFPILSKFISRYLSGQANTVLIESPLVPSLRAEAVFPAPNPRPNILRNVTIKDMKIKPAGNAFLASGVVEARAVLPKGVNVGLDVFRVLPDVLVFDGEVPSSLRIERHPYDEYRGSSPPPETLPDPLPKNAFGRIRPEDWLPSQSVPIEPEGSNDGSAYAVSAKVVDVPLEVLPGRQREFSNFVKKVIFGTEGATAGIAGNSGVTLSVDGIALDGTPGPNGTNLVLVGLPFRGRVNVGKKGLLGFDDDKPDKERARERWKRTWKEILRKLKERLPFLN